MSEVNDYGAVFDPGAVAYDRGELCMGSDLRKPVRGCGDDVNQQRSESCVLFIVYKEPFLKMFSGDEP